MKKPNRRWLVAMTRHRLVAALFVLLLSTSRTMFNAQANDGEVHSHFRFGHITWESAGPNTAQFTFIAGFRRCFEPGIDFAYSGSDPDGCPAVGDIIDEFIGATELCFGDGDCTGQLRFRVFAINKTDNSLQARGLEPGSDIEETITHVYTGPGPFTAFSASCCRIRLPRHINNPDLPYRVSSRVDFDTTASPISLLPPIVDCAPGSVCRFTVTSVDPDAADPERPNLDVRLATPLEMGDFDLRQPPGAEIRDLPGNVFEYRWDTRGVALAPPGTDTLYSTQVVITDPDGSTSALDFLIRIKELPGPPEGLIKVPIRWCGLDGSPSMEDPGVVNRTTTDQVLITRHVRANSRIYYPQANLIFVSGARAGGFPVIEVDDPDGHVFNPRDDRTEFRVAINKCRLAWRDINPAVTGVIAVSINRFVDNARNPIFATLRFAGVPRPRGDIGQQMLNGVASVIDAD